MPTCICLVAICPLPAPDPSPIPQAVFVSDTLYVTFFFIAVPTVAVRVLLLLHDCFQIVFPSESYIRPDHFAHSSPPEPTLVENVAMIKPAESSVAVYGKL